MPEAGPWPPPKHTCSVALAFAHTDTQELMDISHPCRFLVQIIQPRTTNPTLATQMTIETKGLTPWVEPYVSHMNPTTQHKTGCGGIELSR